MPDRESKPSHPNAWLILILAIIISPFLICLCIYLPYIGIPLVLFLIHKYRKEKQAASVGNGKDGTSKPAVSKDVPGAVLPGIESEQKATKGKIGCGGAIAIIIGGFFIVLAIFYAPYIGFPLALLAIYKYRQEFGTNRFLRAIEKGIQKTNLSKLEKVPHLYPKLLAAMAVIVVLISIILYFSHSRETSTENSELIAKIEENVSAITKGLASKKRPATEYNVALATALRNRGVEYGNKSDAESIKQAIINLHQSLEYENSTATFIEIAYFFSCLAHSGVNPELNLIRSDGILNGLNISEGDERSCIQSTSLKALNHIRRGDSGKAGKIFSSLRQFISDKNDDRKKCHIAIEVEFLLEEDWNKKVKISEDLVRISPQNPRYYNYMGLSKFHTNKRELSKQCFERAVAINREYLPALRNLKLLRQKQVPKIEIVSNFEKQSSSEPDNFPYTAVSISYGEIERGRGDDSTGKDFLNIKLAASAILGLLFIKFFVTL